MSGTITYHGGLSAIGDYLAAARREERSRIGRLSDQDLADEMAEVEGFLRSVTGPGQMSGAAVQLRAARHEAIVVRGWDAGDPRIRWEPRDFTGPADEAAYQVGLAVDALVHHLCAGAVVTDAVRRDNLEILARTAAAARDLGRAHGALLQALGLASPLLPQYLHQDLAEASACFSRACDSIRAMPLAGLSPGDEAAGLARRFQAACSELAAAAGSATPADAREALAKIAAAVSRTQDCTDDVRESFRSCNPAADAEFAPAREALIRARKRITISADEARNRSGARPCPRRRPPRTRTAANAAVPNGRGRAARLRLNPGTAARPFTRASDVRRDRLGPPREQALVDALRDTWYVSTATGRMINMSEPAVTHVSEPVDADERLYATMERLLAMYADRQTSEIPGPRGVVERQDALDAVIQVAAVVDQAVHTGAVSVERGMHAAAMLMVLREYLQPLPPAWDGDGCTDHLNGDLATMVGALREARQATGQQG